MTLHGQAIVNVMLTALAAMTKIFLVSLVGYLCARYPKGNPILSPTALQVISRLSNLVLLPNLIMNSLGSGITSSDLRRLCILIVLCMVVNSISYLLVYTVGKRFHGDAYGFFRAVAVAAGSPNSISYPLMVFQTMCEEPIVNGDFQSSSTLCFDQASSMAFVYSIGWHLMFWSYGYQMLKAGPGQQMFEISNFSSVAKVRALLSDKEFVSKSLSSIASVLSAPSMVGIYCGLFIVLVPPLQRSLFGGLTPLRPFGSAITTLGTPVVCLNTLVMSGSLANAELAKPPTEDETASSATSPAALLASGTEKTVGAGVGEGAGTGSNANAEKEDENEEGSEQTKGAIGVQERESRVGRIETHSRSAAQVVSPLHGGVGGEEENALAVEISQPEEPTSTFIGGSDGTVAPAAYQPLSGASAGAGVLDALSPMELGRLMTTLQEKLAEPINKSIITVIVCRLVLPSLIMIPVLKFLEGVGAVLPSQRMLLFIVGIESCAPPAQMIIVCLNQLGLKVVAGRMAYIYIYVYLFSILTLTLWATVYMTIIY